MAHFLEHAKRSARKFGAFLTITCRSTIGSMNRKPSWQTFGIGLCATTRKEFLAERIFGATIRNSEGKDVPVRSVGEQHVREDLGRIPSFQDWATAIGTQPWMYGQRLTKSSEI